MDEPVFSKYPPKHAVNDDLVYKTMGISLNKSERGLLTDAVQMSNVCTLSLGFY